MSWSSQRRGALGRGELGGVGEQLGGGAHAAGLVRRTRSAVASAERGVGGVGGRRGCRRARRPGRGAASCALAALGGVVDAGDGGDVRGVGVAAAGHARRTARPAPVARGDDGVGGVDGAALGGVHGGGVAEREVLGDVGGGQHQPLAELLAVGVAAGDGGDLEAAVVADGE